MYFQLWNIPAGLSGTDRDIHSRTEWGSAELYHLLCDRRSGSSVSGDRTAAAGINKKELKVKNLIFLLPVFSRTTAKEFTEIICEIALGAKLQTVADILHITLRCAE